MATIFRIGPVPVAIYSKDHRPPHVHVFTRERKAKISLPVSGESIRVVSNQGFSRKQLAEILIEIEARQALLLERWS